MILLLLILAATAAGIFTTARLRRLRHAPTLRPALIYSALTTAVLIGPALTHTSAEAWSVLLLALFCYLAVNTVHELRLRHRSPGYRAYREHLRRAEDPVLKAVDRHFREQTAANLYAATHAPAPAGKPRPRGPGRNVS